MGALFDTIGYLAKPLFLALAILVMLGLLEADRTSHLGTVGSFECRGFTTDPEWNRILCQYHPARLLHAPIARFSSGFGLGG